MLWVAYDDEGIPVGVFDTASELEAFLGINHMALYRMLWRGDPQIARISDKDIEDEEVITEEE